MLIRYAPICIAILSAALALQNRNARHAVYAPADRTRRNGRPPPLLRDLFSVEEQLSATCQGDASIEQALQAADRSAHGSIAHAHQEYQNYVCPNRSMADDVGRSGLMTVDNRVTCACSCSLAGA